MSEYAFEFDLKRTERLVSHLCPLFKRLQAEANVKL